MKLYINIRNKKHNRLSPAGWWPPRVAHIKSEQQKTYIKDAVNYPGTKFNYPSCCSKTLHENRRWVVVILKATAAASRPCGYPRRRNDRGYASTAWSQSEEKLNEKIFRSEVYRNGFVQPASVKCGLRPML